MLQEMVKAPCIRTCHSFSEPSGFQEPTHVRPFAWQTSSLPQKGGPPGNGKFVLPNASSVPLMNRESLLDWRRHAAPVKSPATKSTCCWCITERTVSSKFFASPRFLARALLMWSDVVVKKDVPFLGILRNEAREMTACSTRPDC